MSARGSRHTEAARARMSEAKRGTKATPAHRAAIAAGVRRWWASRKQKEETPSASVLATSADGVSKDTVSVAIRLARSA